MGDVLPFDIRRQPDDTSCGPTCLHAVYRYFGDDVGLEEVLHEVPKLVTGGTLGVHLANHALSRGYRARLITWDLRLFDPTWFDTPKELASKLVQQRVSKDDPQLHAAIDAHLAFLAGGGELAFEDLTVGLLRRWLQRGLPILTGLSATFLYRNAREREDTETDDVAGNPVGHFVLMTGYLSGLREVILTDPMHPNPLAETHTYRVSIERALGAIYLGVLTNDANLLVVRPPGHPPEGSRSSDADLRGRH